MPEGGLRSVEPAGKYAEEVTAPDAAEPDESTPFLANTPSRSPPIPRRIPPPARDTPRFDPGSLREPAVSPPTVADTARAVQVPWEEPGALLARLDALSREPATERWATEADQLVRELGSTTSTRPDEAVVIVGRLDELVAQVAPAADGLPDRALATRFRRAGHALLRRLEIWRQVVRSGDSRDTVETEPPVSEQLPVCLAQIDAITGENAEGKAWRQYLLIDALREWSDKRNAPDERPPRELAQRVLRRMTQIPMSQPQRQFVSSGPLATLRDELQHWAAEPVDSGGLLVHLEQYEQTGLASDARLVADDRLYLDVSPDPAERSLAARLDHHYRNANLRLAVTEKLLNRLMPEHEPEHARVRDRILGVPVRGDSFTETKVGMRMVPDPHRVRLALEIEGHVSTLTRSTSGVATFYNDSASYYTARKPLEVSLSGIRLWPAEVAVYNHTQLRDLETDLDPIPLIGWLAKDVARSQHAQKRPAAIREIKRKVAAKARQRIDTEAGQRLDNVCQRLNDKVITPLHTLSLKPTVISAQTSPQRFTMRLRLAGEDQLGSHTPRPRAPSDSLASLQIHQSAINNVLERMDLAGRTFSVPELMAHVAARLHRTEPFESNPDNEDVSITFAEQNPIGVRLEDGRVAVTLSIVKLRKGRQLWKDFQVRAYYQPQIEGRDIKLARDGVVQLIGRRGAQIALRGIFTKVFSKKHPIELTPERLANDPKLADLAITQFVIDDGWIGVALGPQRTAQRTGLLKR